MTRGARVAELEIGGETIVVASFPLPRPELWALSPAEREVATLLVAGASNAEIARFRRRSVRTIANQVASIFRKLGVRSRGELAARAAISAQPTTSPR